MFENSAQKGLDLADRYTAGNDPSAEEVTNALDDSVFSSQVEEEVDLPGLNRSS